MTADNIDALLYAYITEGDRHRAEQAATAWNDVLRPYERRIVREAAVMGYVLGHRDGRLDYAQRNTGGEQPFPADIDIVRRTLEHCATTDGDNGPRFPYLAAAANGRRRHITRNRLWPGETR